MVKVPAQTILPMVAFRDALCITHNPVNGTLSQGREGPRNSPDVASPCGSKKGTGTLRLIRFLSPFYKVPVPFSR